MYLGIFILGYPARTFLHRPNYFRVYLISIYYYDSIDAHQNSGIEGYPPSTYQYLIGVGYFDTIVDFVYLYYAYIYISS